MKKILFLLVLLLPTHALAVRTLNNPFYKVASTVTFFPTPYVAYSRVSGVGGESSLSVGTGTGYAKLNLGHTEMTSPIAHPNGGNYYPIVKLQQGTLNLTEKVNGSIVQPGKIVVPEGVTLGDTEATTPTTPAFLKFGNVNVGGYITTNGTNTTVPISARSVSTTTIKTESLVLFTKTFPACWVENSSSNNPGLISWEKIRLSGDSDEFWYIVCSEANSQGSGLGGSSGGSSKT